MRRAQRLGIRLGVSGDVLTADGHGDSTLSSGASNEHGATGLFTSMDPNGTHAEAATLVQDVGTLLELLGAQHSVTLRWRGCRRRAPTSPGGGR